MKFPRNGDTGNNIILYVFTIDRNAFSHFFLLGVKGRALHFHKTKIQKLVFEIRA